MKKIIVLIIVTTDLFRVYGQRINYFVAFPNIAHHEAQVSLIVSDIQSRQVVFRMSRSSAGRYATHEFNKNVYDVKAFDEKGGFIEVTRADGDVYEVNRHNGYIRLVYTIYGNYADGTYLGIDPSGIHINMPAMFMWMKGADKLPITIHFDIPRDLHWTIATQLKTTADATTFTAPGLQYFMDSPTKIGDLKYRNWEVKNPDGKQYAFRVAFDAKGDDSIFSRFSKNISRIVSEEQAIYGETPAYDYGSYTFLASINPFVHGDGMEHRNSTMISLPVEFHGDNFLLEVFAHEFFHCWNVKRIRPKTLEPFNFEKSNMSNELWFAEGFTQYYGELTIVRSGFDTDTSFAGSLTGYVNTKVNTAGAKFYSPVDASRHAVYVDAGVAVDKTNYPNMFTSYYAYGAALALALDLQLRTQYNKSLDDLMQAAWKRFGKPEIPYTVDGLREVLFSVTNDKKFSEDFFNKFIYGHEPIDYAPLLAKAGFTLSKALPGRAWIGNIRSTDKEVVKLTSNTIRSTPIYEAGIDIDDVIIQFGETHIKTLKDLSDALATHKPGDQVVIVYNHRNEEKTSTITLQENPLLSVLTFESEGKPLTQEIILFRKNWLGSKVR